MEPNIEMLLNIGSQEAKLPLIFSKKKFREVEKFHESLNEYKETPLISLDALAKNLGVKKIYVKDESKRFGLNSFKALGASYGMDQIVRKHNKDEKPVFVTATDGNHGKAVAWAAKRIGCKAYIFLPEGSKECRVKAIKGLGNASVEVTNYNYDDTVRFAQDFAKNNGYYLIQDTRLEGYEKIPDNIMLGYSTMVREALDQMTENKPTHVFLQAGVGSMAGGAAAYLKNYFQNEMPQIGIMEALNTNCFFRSLENGQLSIGDDNGETIMAGLNCNEANPLAYQILKNSATAFFSCPDWVTKIGVRKMASPDSGDKKIESGESGAIGLGLLITLMRLKKYQEYKDQLKLNQDSIILLFSTEGYTDQENCQKILKGLA